MKKVLFSVIAIFSALFATAQSTDEVSAVLQHGDEVSVYKGRTALQLAHAAATIAGLAQPGPGRVYGAKKAIHGLRFLYQEKRIDKFNAKRPEKPQITPVRNQTALCRPSPPASGRLHPPVPPQQAAGAAGQAVQNMNLMFGLKESEGLEFVPMFP